MKTIIIIGCLLIFSGCSTHQPDYMNIPLTNSGIPYQLPEGSYTDTKGKVHVETTKRWSVSEEWMFDYIQNINP